ncbi:MAG: PQQ-binding-like beta-propeller repeat protein [Planctomycetota bacterium]
MKSKDGHIGLIIAVSNFVLACTVSAEATSVKPRERAREILDATGVKGGIVVHLGCDEGRLTAALRANDAYLVRGLDANKERILKAREHIRSQGLYGDVSVAHWESARLPFSDNLVNLVLSQETSRVSLKEIMRVLTPGGVAYLEKDGGWTKRVKPWPEEIDEWTHFLHDASNNPVAEDTRVGPPRQIQWQSGPEWARSHESRGTLHTLVSANGRMFAIIDEGITGQRAGVPSQWRLVARDAFNGKLLWKRAVSRSSPRTLVADGERVYVTLQGGGPVCILDASTGETLANCANTAHAEEIVCHQGIVVCHVRNRKEQRRSNSPVSQGVVAVDGESGAMLWNTEDKVESTSLAAQKERTCYHNGDELVCVALEDGKQLWKTDCKANSCVVMHDEVVLLLGRSPAEAFSASTGERLWKGSPRARKVPGAFVANGLLWSAWPSGNDFPRLNAATKNTYTLLWEAMETVRQGYDIKTGEVKRTVTAKRLVTPGHHIRCYTPKATSRYLLLNKRGVEFFDLQGDNHMRHNWLRPGCGYGAMPANGFLYVPPDPCFCYPGVKISGFNAFTSQTGLQAESSGETKRLFRGPAWGAEIKSHQGAKESEWPTYRHDPRRSGSVDFNLPARVECLWETSIGCKPSPPVAADGKIFVAAVDGHAVECLDAESGQSLWSYTADARVDSPPTIYQGRALFGVADGHVYCLRASDGKLIWRFQAAPGIQQIGVRDQIESAWPSHGSVLVRDDKAYVTAGRASYLEGGVWMYALDPKTGEVLHQRQIHDPAPDVSKDGGRPYDMDGARSDILVAGEKDIYMLQKRFKPDLGSVPMPRITKLGDRKCELHLMATGGFLDRQRSDGAFNRLFWTHSRRWPGYYFVYDQAPKSGQILVFDEETTYAVRYYTKRHGHSPEFELGSGYEMVADPNTSEPVLRPPRYGQEKGGGFSREQFWKWLRKVPVRVDAMVLANDHLYLAGPPDLGPGNQAADAIRGLNGARFRVVSTSDGKKVSEIELDKSPVFDGLIAAFGRLYMASRDGTIICLGTK